MTLTLLDVYNECAGQPWSMFDNDATSEDDFESGMKISINKAVSFLWNYQPWSFRMKKKIFRTKAGTPNYNMPNGMLRKSTIDGTIRYGLKCDGQFLKYEPSYELLDTESGKPEYFYIMGDTIYLYPCPDKTYSIEATYLAMNYAMSADDEEKGELVEDDDYINITEKYEYLFKNCLISLAMLYAIADESDENYSGYLKQYEDALSILVDYCKNSIIDKNITW